MIGDSILLLDGRARAGRTGHRLTVKNARDLRAKVRWSLGVSRDDTPTVEDILSATKHLSTLLYDATAGDAILAVRLKGEDNPLSPAVVLSTLQGG